MALYNTSIDYANFWSEQLSTLKVAGWILIGLFVVASILACIPGGQPFSAFIFTTWGILAATAGVVGLALLGTAYYIENSDKYKNGVLQRDELISQINNDPTLSPSEKQKLKAEATRYHGDYKPSGWPKLALALATPISSAVTSTSEAVDHAVKAAGEAVSDATDVVENVVHGAKGVSSIFTFRPTILLFGIVGILLILKLTRRNS